MLRNSMICPMLFLSVFLFLLFGDAVEAFSSSHPSLEVTVRPFFGIKEKARPQHIAPSSFPKPTFSEGTGRLVRTMLRAELDDGETVVAGAFEQAKSSCEQHFGPSVDVYEFELKEHKPLGCTVEESLVEEEDSSKHVFVSKVKVDGNAARCGIEEGDVVLAVTGSFEDIMIVTGLGLDKVRPLIAGHPEDDPITIFVARGTDVQAKHDTMLVDICTFNEGLDSQIEECIVNLNTYDMAFDDEEPTIDCDDADTECMLDQVFGTWEEEMPGISESDDDGKDEEESKPKKPKIAPWSSRSSPSGTFVRDPKTGRMVNIDA